MEKSSGEIQELFLLPWNCQEKLGEIPGNPEQTDSNRKAQDH